MPADLGKASDGVMRTILSESGTEKSTILMGPKRGIDCGVVSIGKGKVLVASTDPISFIPSLGPEDSAWLSVHALASDIATSGLSPEYALFDLNLPPRMSDTLLTKFWKSVHTTCKELKVGVLGGHTGRFEGCDYTIIGAGTMLSLGPSDQYVTSDMAQDGDELIATKSPALETTAVLARTFPRFTRARLGSETQRGAAELLRKITTVKDSIAAASGGLHEQGVTAMHDVTEGGIVSAVLDIAEASRLKATVDVRSIPIYDEVREVCRLFKIDPLTSLGQGCLVIASRPHRSGRIISRLRSAGITASVIGSLAKKRNASMITDNKRRRRLARPARDSYWRAYWGGVRKHLD